ncbi:MAG: FMN-binding protein [Bacteroidales bacterium]|nr:FMN-binding protein [Bacteroidales bacterium]MBR2227023.1 FMN-binding protein [Bacteroidales bacterium]MBR3097230.1 FMN-binding protein [Bacteroidales bacterium]
MLFQKKVLFYITVATVFLGTFAVSSSCGNRRAAQGADTLKVNTKELAADVMGFNGPTPVEISIYKGIITDIKVLPNQEGPRYLQRVLESGLLKGLVGKTPAEARAAKLDAVTGATYTSSALIENIRRGLKDQ